MNVYLEIENKHVHEELSQKGNTLRSQTLYMWTVGEKYPRQFKLSLGSNPAYDVGCYLFGSTTFRADRFLNVEIDGYNIELVPMSDALLKLIKEGK